MAFLEQVKERRILLFVELACEMSNTGHPDLAAMRGGAQNPIARFGQYGLASHSLIRENA
jgi:hypothetical protein